MHDVNITLEESVVQEASKPHRSHTRQPASRIGKTGVTFYLAPDAIKQLRIIGVDEDITLQKLMIEATNMLFRVRGKAEIAR